MASAVFPLLTVLLVLVAVVLQFNVVPVVLHTLGVGKALRPVRPNHCEKIAELQGCEDGWYHQPSGLLYLACSDPAQRPAWLPNMNFLDAPKRALDDYIAILDTKATGPASSRITKVSLRNFAGVQGDGTINVHGIGVHLESPSLEAEEVEQQQQPKLRVFLVNHRPPLVDSYVGANSTVELFETTLGSDSMDHIRTYHADAISTPNDVCPTGPDSFAFSNDHSVKAGHGKMLDFFAPLSSVGFCDGNSQGCKLAMTKVPYPNGLAGGSQFPHTNPNLIYSVSTSDRKVRVMELQADGSLILLDEIQTEYPMDNPSVDVDGNLWIAAFPKMLQMAGTAFRDPSLVAPSAVLKVSKNTGRDAFFGQKYLVERALEDDGKTVSSPTFAQYDTERKLLFMGGIMTPYLAVCQLS